MGNMALVVTLNPAPILDIELRSIRIVNLTVLQQFKFRLFLEYIQNISSEIILCQIEDGGRGCWCG